MYICLYSGEHDMSVLVENAVRSRDLKHENVLRLKGVSLDEQMGAFIISEFVPEYADIRDYLSSLKVCQLRFVHKRTF